MRVDPICPQPEGLARPLKAGSGSHRPRMKSHVKGRFLEACESARLSFSVCGPWQHVARPPKSGSGPEPARSAGPSGGEPMEGGGSRPRLSAYSDGRQLGIEPR